MGFCLKYKCAKITSARVYIYLYIFIFVFCGDTCPTPKYYYKYHRFNYYIYGTPQVSIKFMTKTHNICSRGLYLYDYNTRVKDRQNHRIIVVVKMAVNCENATYLIFYL